MVHQQIYAGAAEAVITPPVGTPLLGCVLPSTGVHDDLFARALVLSASDRRVALVSLDLVGLDLAAAARIRAEVTAATGVGTVLLNCSHTHSAPFTIPWSVLGWQWLDGPGRGWSQALPRTVVEVVGRAAARPTPVELRFGRAPVQVGTNRRLAGPTGVTMAPNPEGPVAPWTDVLSAVRPDGQPLAVLFTHAAHPVIVHGASTLISADYPGYAVAAVRQGLGADVAVLFAAACGANLNGDPLRGGFDAAARAGAALGNAVLTALAASQPLTGPSLVAESATARLPCRELPDIEACEPAVREAETQLAEAEGRRAGTAQLWYLRDTVLCLRDLLNRARRGQSQELPFPATAVRLGDDCCLLALAHEVFVDYQLWAETASPFAHNLVLAYTNGCESYLPTDHELTLGGYEAASFPTAGAALRYPRRVALEAGLESRIKTTVRELWQPLLRRPD